MTLTWPMDETGEAFGEHEKLLAGDPETVETYLSMVVHRKDRKFLKKLVKKSDHGTYGGLMADLAYYLYTQIDPAAGNDVTAIFWPLLPVLPQPFYGSPEKAKLFVILTSPAYDQRFIPSAPGWTSEQFAQACFDQYRNGRRLLGDIEADEYKYVPWEETEGYYKEMYYGAEGSSAQYLVPLWNEALGGSASFDEAHKDFVFHTHLSPYQVTDSSSVFVQALRDLNESGQWLPSQEALLKVAAAWVNCYQLGEQSTERVLYVGSARREFVDALLVKLEEYGADSEKLKHVLALPQGLELL
ncbi:hypothetical protein [Actinomyces vulturis]|uniref:hypothetical protein n=1 Tax=Actinomyces vulturis TaxID=1857645 RepID=UPI00159ED0A1|nr:hypothetical protein [Actinomyces vulturis]